jgi:hypothetical protein
MLRSSLTVTAILLLGAPVVASASTARVDPFDGRIHVTAADGETNVVSIRAHDPAWQPFVDDTAGVTTNGSCWFKSATRVECPGGARWSRSATRTTT